MFISGTKSQTKQNKALGKTHTTKSTAMPINILVSANSCGEIDDDDNGEWPPAEEIPARHAAAWRIFIAVIIVVVVTMITMNVGIPTPYTKAIKVVDKFLVTSLELTGYGSINDGAR